MHLIMQVPNVDEIDALVKRLKPLAMHIQGEAVDRAFRAGDLLVASSTPGHAMRGTDRTRMLGAVVGKALESQRR